MTCHCFTISIKTNTEADISGDMVARALMKHGESLGFNGLAVVKVAVKAEHKKLMLPRIGKAKSWRLDVDDPDVLDGHRIVK